jgi:hypothetical protein
MAIDPDLFAAQGGMPRGTDGAKTGSKTGSESNIT